MNRLTALNRSIKAIKSMRESRVICATCVRTMQNLKNTIGQLCFLEQARRVFLHTRGLLRMF